MHVSHTKLDIQTRLLNQMIYLAKATFRQIVVYFVTEDAQHLNQNPNVRMYVHSPFTEECKKELCKLRVDYVTKSSFFMEYMLTAKRRRNSTNILNFFLKLQVHVNTDKKSADLPPTTSPNLKQRIKTSKSLTHLVICIASRR